MPASNASITQRTALTSLMLLVALATSLLGIVPAAQAGQYNVYLCKTPSGNTVPLGLVAGWSGFDVTVADDCGGRGGVVSFWDRARNPPDFARAEVGVPSGIGIAQANITRRVSIQPGSDFNAVPEWAVYRDAADYDDYHLIERCFPTGCYSIDWPSGSVLTANFPPNDRAKTIIWEVRCGGAPGGTCSGAASGERIVATVLSMHLVLEETSLPDGTASGPATQLATTKTGVVNAQVNATDTGAGVYQAYARLGEIEVGRVTVGGACADRGNNPSSELDFEALQPCPASVNGWTLPINTATAGVGNGSRRLRINVRDAAGNDTLIFNDFVTVSNSGPAPAPTPTPTPAPLPAPTPTPTPTATASPAPTLLVETARPPATPEGKIVIRSPGRSVGPRAAGVVSGQVVNPAGQPVRRAALGVELRLRVAGAPWTPGSSVTTDDEGRFAVSVPPGASREVRLTYAHAAGTATAQATVSVRAGLAISPAAQRVRRFGSLRLAGRLNVEGLPRRGAYVDLQLRDRGSWRTISTVRTDQSGKWRWSYRLASGQRATYQFRARLRPAADVASAATTSRTVTVRVR